MQIRRATLNDLDDIESLWQEMVDFHLALDDYYSLAPEAHTNHREYMAGLIQDETRRIFVAEDNGQLLGYLMAEVSDYPPIYIYKSYGHIGAISVAASARRTGIGRQLLEIALDWFCEQGLQRVECGVAVNNSVSQGFWKAMGFRGIVERCVMDLAG